jgi:ribosomal protein S6--L-glutamate ligase
MKIAILTKLPGYYTEQRLAEEAEKRGHEVVMLRYPACYVVLDENGGKVLKDGEEITGLDAVIPRSFAGSLNYGVSVLRQLENNNVYTTAKSLAIMRAVDMLRSIQLLSRKDVDVPKSVFLREPSQADQLIDHVGLPVVVRVPAVASRRGGNSTVLAETRKAVASVMSAFYVTDATFVMQEYVNPENASSVRVYVVGSSVVASAKRAGVNIGDQTSGKGDKLTGIAMLDESQKKMAVRAAKALGLTCCSVDMIVSKDRTVVVNVDPYAGIESLEKATGRNIADKIIEYIELNAKRHNKKDKVGA